MRLSILLIASFVFRSLPVGSSSPHDSSSGSHRSSLLPSCKLLESLVPPVDLSHLRDMIQASAREYWSLAPCCTYYSVSMAARGISWDGVLGHVHYADFAE